jgi:hypothetical protein
MKKLKFETQEEWLQARKGKITGTKLKDLVVLRGDLEKDLYYQMIADELLREPIDEDENPMDRGHRLEPVALERFTKETGKKVKQSNNEIYFLDENPNIALSPDGSITITEMVEAKGLCPKKQIRYYIEWTKKNMFPKEFYFQAIQYFVVNKKLKTLYFAFICPELTSKDFFIIELTRKELKEEIEKWEKYQIEKLEEINEIVAEFKKEALELTEF